MSKELGKNRAYVVTGPTSGIGRKAALELAQHGTVVLVGRNAKRLADVGRAIEKRRGRAVVVVCDLSDPGSARKAGLEVARLGLSVAGLLNNAGVRSQSSTPAGWNTTFVTNHLGPLALTEALIPSLADGTNILFVVSAVEDPERKPAVAAGFRGGRLLSVEAAARGEWAPGGSTRPGGDAYATSKQCALATARELAREHPRLRINALEPGVTPGTNLGREAGLTLRFLEKVLVPALSPLLRLFFPFLTTPTKAGRNAVQILLNAEGQTGVYFDERGRPMTGSELSRDPAFTRRVLTESRAWLSAHES